jgi:Domain of unknown function (DUF4279)
MASEPERCVLKAYFVVSGRDWDPREFAASVGLGVGEVWHQRRAHLRAHPDFATDEWFVEVGKREGYDVNDPLSEVLDVVWPARTAIRTFVRQHRLSAAVVCVAEEYGRGPAYVVPTATLRRIAYFGAELSFDIYDYGPVA